MCTSVLEAKKNQQVIALSVMIEKRENVSKEKKERCTEQWGFNLTADQLGERTLVLKHKITYRLEVS